MQFAFRVRTSRGSMTEKTSWFLKVWDDTRPAITGVGEASPLKGLSPEEGDGYDNQVRDAAGRLSGSAAPSTPAEALVLAARVAGRASSIRFAVETALLDLLHGGGRVIFKDCSFVQGKPVPINGLIWMGGVDYMLQQVVDKIAEGYRCVKLKVGGLNFERECDILQYIRRKYFREDITIRLDANGAFKEEDALVKLAELSKYGVESIEQPLKAGSPLLAELCAKSPIPIALDEELIGLDDEAAKIRLLDRIRPACIVIKPTLHGGLAGAGEWIKAARARKVKWWLTSALESSVGLNAIAQLASTYDPSVPQGLGTGKIFENNLKSPLSVKNGSLFWDPAGSWTESSEEES
jgi:o-succinylbenzoate synthase